jgi:hypothetical protein
MNKIFIFRTEILSKCMWFFNEKKLYSQFHAAVGARAKALWKSELEPIVNI